VCGVGVTLSLGDSGTWFKHVTPPIFLFLYFSHDFSDEVFFYFSTHHSVFYDFSNEVFYLLLVMINNYFYMLYESFS
jgi:hypothetical protein